MESGECLASVCAGGRDGSLQQGRGLLKTFCVRFINPLLHAMNFLLKGLHYPAVLMHESVSVLKIKHVFLSFSGKPGECH